MGCAQSRLRTKVDIRDLEASVHTGDIILFSSKHAASQVTKFFTASTWDHCGIVVKFGSRHVFVLEYAGGVYLYPLFTRLYTYYAVQGRVISLRRLLPGQDRAEMQKKVELFVRNVLGKSPPSITELLTAFLKQEQYITSFISRLAGADEKVAVRDSLDTMFCSKLIAAIYKDIGLIEPHRAAADFMPKHFSASFDDFLDLQRGAILGPELPINFESVQAEIEQLKEQMADDSRLSSEDVVRAISNFYLTATSGLGNVGTAITRSLTDLERGLHGYSAAAEAAVWRVSSKSDLTEVPSTDGADGEPAGAAGADAPPTSPPPREPGVGGVQLSASHSPLVREVLSVSSGNNGVQARTRDGKVADEGRQPLLAAGPQPTGADASRI